MHGGKCKVVELIVPTVATDITGASSERPTVHGEVYGDGLSGSGSAVEPPMMSTAHRGPSPPPLAKEPPGYEAFEFGPGPHTLTVETVLPRADPDIAYVYARYKVRAACCMLMLNHAPSSDCMDILPSALQERGVWNRVEMAVPTICAGCGHIHQPNVLRL
jgi:hypothetical protein